MPSPQFIAPRRNRGWLPGATPLFAPIAPGLEAAYVFGTSGYDISGHNRHCTPVMPQNRRIAAFGSSAYLDASLTQSISIPTSTTNFSISAVTLCTLIQTSTSGSITLIVNWDLGEPGHPAARVWQYRLTAAGVFEFIVFLPDNTTAGICTGTTFVADGRPHFLIGTWDGKNVRVFVDGKLDGPPLSFVGTLNPLQNLYDIEISQTSTNSGGSYYTGHIGYLAIYSKGITASQARDLSMPFGGLTFPEDAASAQMVGVFPPTQIPAWLFTA